MHHVHCVADEASSFIVRDLFQQNHALKAHASCVGLELQATLQQSEIHSGDKLGHQWDALGYAVAVQRLHNHTSIGTHLHLEFHRSKPGQFRS